MEQAVGVDEGEVLALLVRETRLCLLPSSASLTASYILQKFEPIAEWIASIGNRQSEARNR